MLMFVCQAMHKMDDIAAAAQELRVAVALLRRLLVCEPTLALELPKLELGHGAIDVLSLLTRALDAAASLTQPDLDLLGAYAADVPLLLLLNTTKDSQRHVRIDTEHNSALSLLRAASLSSGNLPTVCQLLLA